MVVCWYSKMYEETTWIAVLINFNTILLYDDVYILFDCSVEKNATIIFLFFFSQDVYLYTSAKKKIIIILKVYPILTDIVY